MLVQLNIIKCLFIHIFTSFLSVKNYAHILYLFNFFFDLVIRDYDGYFYIREKNGGYLAGGFEPVSKPIDLKEMESPTTVKPLPENWDQFRKFVTPFVSL